MTEPTDPDAHHRRTHLVAAGLSLPTAEAYDRILVRAERLLDARGVDLATCQAADLAAICEAFPASHSRRSQLRSALTYGGRLAGRPDLTVAAVPVPSKPRETNTKPLSRKDAETFERAAWGIGGHRGFAALLSLHTPLHGAALAELRWEQFNAAGGRMRLELRDGVRLQLHPRLARAVTAQGAPSGYVFPGSTPRSHLKATTINGLVRSVAALGGLPKLSLKAIAKSKPGDVDPDQVPPLAARNTPLLADMMVSGLGVGEILATGVSERTAYLYVRILNRVAALLAERDTDLATCSGVDLAAVARCFPNTNSSRSQLRGALTRGWEAIGREHTPSLRAVRIPPKPRGRSRALPEAHAQALEQAAWERDDLPGLAVLIGLYAGLRRMEIATLRWERLEVDADGHPRWLRVLGKGDLVADVPVHPVLSEALLRFRRRQGWIFPGRNPGTSVLPATIWSWVKLVASEAGLADVATHLLRHTALTEANDRSGDLRTVQEIARHARPEITAVYTRVTGQRMQDVVAMIDYGRHVDAGIPDPAVQLPGIGYRQLVATLLGAEVAERWVELGLLLHPLGWELVVDATGPTLSWVWSEHPELQASADRHSFSLFRMSTDEDLAEMWDLHQPSQLLALAQAIAADIPVPDAIRLGPWIEEPFREFLNGERPDLLGELRRPHLVVAG